MSRKMIDYQVENGKISTIDGYKVGAKDTKYQINLVYKSAYCNIPAKDYAIGDKIFLKLLTNKDNNIISADISPDNAPVVEAGAAVFIATTPVSLTADGRTAFLLLSCIKAGTATETVYRPTVYISQLNEQES